MNIYLELLLSILLAASAIALVRVRDLFALVVLLSVYSAVISLIFAMLGAVDVAFTEAVVGTGVSTVFLMAFFKGARETESDNERSGWALLPPIVAIAFGVVLLLGVHGLPEFGSLQAPANIHISPEYGKRSLVDMATPNVVTAILADYRSFDTLIETAVVLTAALSCMLILRKSHD